MPIYLKDLLENPNVLREARGELPRCCKCGVPLQETITGKRHTPKGEACSDCFYEMLSEGVEAHPIVSAGIRRG